MYQKKISNLLFLIFAWFLSAAQDTTQQIITGRVNAKEQEQKPYVILISADGFRADLALKYNATNLLRLREEGVQAEYMLSSYPSLTFPNHYTIATGLYPSHHGLVDNTFYDREKTQLFSMSNKIFANDSSWYGGTPLWVLAEKQNMLSASYFWVGSETAIQGIRPSYFYWYNEKTPIDVRINALKKWLQLPESKRPHLITFYFPEVDHEAHTYGIDSKETAKAVKFVDESMGRMVAEINKLNLPVNYIFVSDHGMATVDSDKAIPLPVVIDTNQFYVPRSSALLHLYTKDKPFIKPTYKALKKDATKYDVYLKKNMPRRWHYSKRDDRYNRIGDIILIPHLPGFFNISKRKDTNLGKHGFDNYLSEMHATFYAWGPAFKQHVKINGFENIHIYPLITEILGLTYDRREIDGKLKVLKPILK